MPCPHFKISIIKRSAHQSAVAAAAYQSGEVLFCEYDNRKKAYTEKRGIVYTEIMLPSNAPAAYADRNTLWNAVEAVENKWNSQLARRIILALPREVPKEQYPQMLRDFCQEHFVSRGMCADFAIHDKRDGNPHAHIILTMRSMDEKGNWQPKSRKVYNLDENGQRYKCPNSRYWSSHKEEVVDWNHKKYAEIWRHGWETVTNKYLERNNRTERVDLRSLERQGSEMLPTVHLGPAIHQMEKRGIKTNIGNINRDVQKVNKAIADKIRSINSLLDEQNRLDQNRYESIRLNIGPFLSDVNSVLFQYFETREKERREQPGDFPYQESYREYEEIMHSVNFIRSWYSVNNAGDVEREIDNLVEKTAQIKEKKETTKHRMKEIEKLKDAAEERDRLQPIHDRYIRLGWKSRKRKFYDEYRTELDAYDKAYRYVRSHSDGNEYVSALRLGFEYERLERELESYDKDLEKIQNDDKELKKILWYVSKVAPQEIHTIKINPEQIQPHLQKEDVPEMVSEPEPEPEKLQNLSTEHSKPEKQQSLSSEQPELSLDIRDEQLENSEMQQQYDIPDVIEWEDCEGIKYRVPVHPDGTIDRERLAKWQAEQGYEPQKPEEPDEPEEDIEFSQNRGRSR